MTLLFSRHTGPLNMGIFAFVSLHTASPSQACMYVPSSTTVSGGAELSYPPLPRPRPPPGDRPPNPPRPPGDRPPPRPAGGLIESQRMRLGRTGARWNVARHASGCGRRALGSEAERGEERRGEEKGTGLDCKWRRRRAKQNPGKSSEGAPGGTSRGAPSKRARDDLLFLFRRGIPRCMELQTGYRVPLPPISAF